MNIRQIAVDMYTDKDKPKQTNNNDNNTDNTMTNNDILNQLLNDKSIEKTNDIKINTQTIASLTTCGLGMVAIWSNNKMIKYSFSALLLYKVFKLYLTDKNVKKFIDEML